MNEATKLARLLVDLADEERARRYRPVMRRAARLLVTGQASAADGGCARCGKPLEQKPRGRPRKWCSERCRRKIRVNGIVVAMAIDTKTAATIAREAGLTLADARALATLADTKEEARDLAEQFKPQESLETVVDRMREWA